MTLFLDDHVRLLGIVRLAREARAAQKRYFRTKSGLEESKELERRLDAALKE